MNYANNPQAFLNGFFSSMRNVFLLSSVGVAMFGFSNTFKLNISSNIIKLITILIFFVSLSICITNITAFSQYINILDKDKKNIPNYINLNIWRSYLYLAYVYALILTILILFALIRAYRYNKLLNKIFKRITSKL